MTIHRPLYTRDSSGSVRFWRMEVEGAQYRSIAGVVGGAEVTSGWSNATGKNVGRSNETTATQQAIAEDGWLRTGDLARKGPLGAVMFVGRQKDVIMHGGYTVYSLEVQDALEEHPDVAEAAVTALADERLGEIPVAAVRLVEGSKLTADELDLWVREHLAEYKVPVRLLIVDELPRTGTNKVQKSELKALFG